MSRAGAAFAYRGGAVESLGYLALPEGTAPCTGILIAPAFGGLSDFERDAADRLAARGHAALVADYYGGGARASDGAEAGRWMAALMADRPEFAARMQGALAALGAVGRVDPARLGAMGFCLGGKAVLDLARSGADFRAGVAIHGIFDAPPAGSQPMKAALMVLHGWDDPLAPPEAVTALAAELSAHCPDWQIHAFGHTGHAFTNPAANAAGMAYSESAARRAWRMLDGFFDEML